MNSQFLDNLYIGLYLAIWVLTFLWYQLKRNCWDGGSAIIGSYIVYAIFSIMSLNDDLFSIQYEPLRIFPFIYLYIMLMIALLPAIHHHLHPVSQIEKPETRVLKPICWILVICALLLLPSIIQNFGDGLIKLFTDVEAGQEAYDEQLENADEAGSLITNIPAIFFNAFYETGIFLAFYFLTLKKRPLLLTLSTFIALIIGLLLPVMRGQRGIVIINISTIIMAYMLFQEYIDKRITRWFRIVGVTTMIAVSLPVVAITVSRFGERNAGVMGYLSWYVGQENLYFNNSAMDAGGIRYGDRTLNLFKRLIDPSTPKNFIERRDKYHNLEIDDYYFTTFVGDFCLDFGPIVTVFIFVIFNLWVISQIRPRDGTLKLHQLLLIYFAMCICMQGGMTLFAFSDTGNLKMIILILLYVYLRYHEQLLLKFPLLRQTTDS
ncbi:MAG: oligosaccharide repeat unit polymerase [Bacteroidaceae bacterium]|nr:oligosaccharide repeat unit polymerase [Bacteroidaceae bacterium]